LIDDFCVSREDNRKIFVFIARNVSKPPMSTQSHNKELEREFMRRHYLPLASVREHHSQKMEALAPLVAPH